MFSIIALLLPRMGDMVDGQLDGDGVGMVGDNMVGDMEVEQFVCAQCGGAANQRCTGCHITFYCSRSASCQWLYRLSAVSCQAVSFKF